MRKRLRALTVLRSTPQEPLPVLGLLGSSLPLWRAAISAASFRPGTKARFAGMGANAARAPPSPSAAPEAVLRRWARSEAAGDAPVGVQPPSPPLLVLA
jgi:hypothetical protein